MVSEDRLYSHELSTLDATQLHDRRGLVTMHYLNLFTDIDHSKVGHYGVEEVGNRSLRINALRWYVVDFQAI